MNLTGFAIIGGIAAAVLAAALAFLRGRRSSPRPTPNIEAQTEALEHHDHVVSMIEEADAAESIKIETISGLEADERTRQAAKLLGDL